MTLDFDTIVRIAGAFSSHNSFNCPHCGTSIDVHDCDVLPQIVSYWGDDIHDFSCGDCGKDFVVKEIVTRQFEAAKTVDHLP